MAKIEIEVKRVRSSVTQGSADVYVNGEKIISFEDEILLIPEGEVYYGEMIDGWASTKSDADFIKGAILWQPLYEQSERLARPFIKEVDKTISIDAKRRPERKSIEMITEALQKHIPFDDNQVDAGITEILNTEIEGHTIDLGASLEFLTDPSNPDFADGTYYIFNLFVDGVYVKISGAWSLEEIQNDPEFLVNYIVGAWEHAALKLDESPAGSFEAISAGELEKLSAGQEQSRESYVRNRSAVKPRR